MGDSRGLDMEERHKAKARKKISGGLVREEQREEKARRERMGDWVEV